jgi:hypothetical protein
MPGKADNNESNTDQEVGNYSQNVKSGLLTVFINKILFEHSHTH